MTTKPETTPAKPSDAALAQRVFFLTTDPTAMLDGKPLPAATTMLYRVCGNDPDKFHEATRLIELFIREALATGRAV